MKKCDKCGKEYKLNKYVDILPERFREKFKYAPSCDCEAIESEKKIDELWEKQLMDSKLDKIKKYINISVVDKKFQESYFENADLSDKHMIVAKKYAEKFIVNDGLEKGIIFFGNPGTGKTFASACISNHLMNNGKTVLALSLSSYLSKLKKEWDEAEQDVLEHVRKCDLLVLDDFGTEHKTEWAVFKIFALIDTRYRSGKPMLITTNLDYSDNADCEITRKFSIDGKNRIKDRIKDMCFPLKCVGESRRTLNKDEFLEKLFA